MARACFYVMRDQVPFQAAQGLRLISAGDRKPEKCGGEGVERGVGSAASPLKKSSDARAFHGTIEWPVAQTSLLALQTHTAGAPDTHVLLICSWA